MSENNDLNVPEAVDEDAVEVATEVAAETIEEAVVAEESTTEVVVEEPKQEKSEEVVIALAEKVADETPTLDATPDNVISSGKTPKKAKKVEEPKEVNPDSEKVAIYSSRTVNWQGVGDIRRGYNIVSKSQADKWLTRIHVRLATPEEIAKEFGN